VWGAEVTQQALIDAGMQATCAAPRNSYRYADRKSQGYAKSTQDEASQYYKKLTPKVAMKRVHQAPRLFLIRQEYYLENNGNDIPLFNRTRI